MSATRDKTQKIAFVYQNLYQIYRKGAEAARSSDAGAQPFAAPSSSRRQDASAPSARSVLKAEDLRAAAAGAQQGAPAPRIEEYKPAELIGKRLAKPEALKQALAQNKRDASGTAAIQSLKQNLKQLNDLHARLRFMLQELEELSKE